MCSNLRDPRGAQRTRAKCAVRARLAGTRPLYSELGAARERRADTVLRQAEQVHLAHDLRAYAGTPPDRIRTAGPWWRNEAVRHPEATTTTIPETSSLPEPRPSLPGPGNLAG